MSGVNKPALRRMILAALLAVPFSARAAEITIATWNLNWLTTREAGDPELPSDVTPRQPEDFERLAHYAQELNADVVALEEVDGFKAASLLFPRSAYSLHFTHDHVVQRVGIAVRRGLHYSINPDLTALSARHLRSGADITLHLGKVDVRILAVHLKKGCRATPLSEARSQPCRELAEQVAPLTDWIAAREQENVPFVVLGDFNRWMNGHDSLLAALNGAGHLVRATTDRKSPCWGGEDFIDHIFAGDEATQWLQPDTLKVMVYQETGKEWQDRLSDHCPLSVQMNVPE